MFDSLFGFQSYKTETVESEKVSTVFYQTGDSKIELLQALHPDSAIHKFIEKKGEGIHHLAFEVENIEAEAGSGAIVINPLINHTIYSEEGCEIVILSSRIFSPEDQDTFRLNEK